MSACFMGVPAANIEQFFRNLVLSDMSMPHSSEFLSPITFSDYLARNGIMSYDMLSIYTNACHTWQEILRSNPVLLALEPRANNPVEIAYQKQDGWNLVIDFFKRLLRIKEIPSEPYKMHFLAHLCRAFYMETAELKDDQQKLGYRAVFNSMIAPVMYEPLIPTNYFFMPVKNYLDLSFVASVGIVCQSVENFINVHSASNINFKVYDRLKMDLLRTDIDAALTGIVADRYKPTEAWAKPLNVLFAKANAYKTDLELCELSETFRRDKMESILLIDKIMKTKRRFDEHRYDDDAEAVIDRLLEIRPKKPVLQATKDFIKDNLIDTMRRPLVSKERKNEKTDPK